MREGFDKEIDSLLRRAARAPAGARGNGAAAAKPDTHLDADELAAFAEGALPDAARTNVVSHLADCGECRALAVNLTRAAGVESKLEKHAVAAAASREPVAKRGWLASFFAPRTLRYVAPALVVCLVAVVSFIAIRSRNGGFDRVASLGDEKNTGASPSAVTTQSAPQPTSEGLTTSEATANANASTTAPTAEAPALADKNTTGAPAAEFRNKDVGTDAPDGSAGPVAPAESKAAGEGAAASQPAPPPPAKEDAEAAGVSTEPREAAKSAKSAEVPASKSGDNMKGGAAPAPVQANDEVASNESQALRRSAQQQRGVEPQAPDGGRQRSAANSVSNSGALASTPRDDRDARARREASPGSGRARSDKDSAAESERSNASVESRSVAGHRFRREGGAWVDVNYKSSMSSTGVRRGTDAYRSLVADIPELGRVAEQLGGEVIVVLRGRAYRIR